MTDMTLEHPSGRTPSQARRPGGQAQTPTNDGILPVTRVEHGTPRTVGVFDLTGDEVQWHPVLDVQRLAEGAQVVAGIAVVGAATAVTAWALHRGREQVGHVSMGPGGWVSVRGPRSLPRGVRAAAPQPPSTRPWWARVLRAQPAAEPVVAPRRRPSWHR